MLPLLKGLVQGCIAWRRKKPITYDAWDQPQGCNLRDSIIVHFEETASDNKKTLIRGKKAFINF